MINPKDEPWRRAIEGRLDTTSKAAPIRVPDATSSPPCPKPLTRAQTVGQRIFTWQVIGIVIFILGWKLPGALGGFFLLLGWVVFGYAVYRDYTYANSGYKDWTIITRIVTWLMRIYVVKRTVQTAAHLHEDHQTKDRYYRNVD